MNRRQFTLAIGLGALGAASRTQGMMLDALGSAVTESALAGKRLNPADLYPQRVVEHWRVVENNSWRWLERSLLVDGAWTADGMTLPVNRQTGVPIDGRDCADYLIEAHAPEGLLDSIADGAADYCLVREGAAPGPGVMPGRKAREGRPPSLWSRRLEPADLRAWLGAFEPPRADVSGMTFFEHLTRDHGFDEWRVAGLTESEQAKLHGAAHAGY